MAESKKAWITPELTVLVRSKPEEAVLEACKWNNVAGGVDWIFNACRTGGCDTCYVVAVS